jgi:hypothetical protein
MVNQSRPHLLRDLNANSTIRCKMTLHLIPEPEEKASELLHDLTANDNICGSRRTRHEAQFFSSSCYASLPELFNVLFRYNFAVMLFRD